MIDEMQIARSLRRLDALTASHPEIVDRSGPGWTESTLAALLDTEDYMPKQSKTVQVAFRLDPELVARLDRHAERMSEAMPGLTFSRVDALKALLVPALDAAERATKKRT